MTVKGQRFAGKKDNLPSPANEDVSYIPAEFADDPEKKDLWLFLCEDMKNRGIYSPTYFLTMQSLVENVIMKKRCLAHMEDHGRVMEKTNRNGDVVGMTSNPSFDQYTRLELLINKSIEKLGLSPRDIVFLEHSDKTAEDAIRVIDQGAPKGIVYFAD